MATEAEAHRRQQAVGVGVFLARAEAREQRIGQHRHRDTLFDGGIDGPAAFATVGDGTAVVVQTLVTGQGLGGQVKQPGRHHAATTPHLGDIGQIEVEALIFRQGVGALALHQFEALGISLHQAVLDAVVDHLHVVTGADRAGVDVAALGALIRGVAALGALEIAIARGEGIEQRLEMLEHGLLGADHHAVAALQAPHAAGSTHIDVVQALQLEGRGTADVVLVEGVAAIDDGVAGFHQLGKRGDGLLGDLASRQHDPDGARRLELLNQFHEAIDVRRTVGDQ